MPLSTRSRAVQNIAGEIGVLVATFISVVRRIRHRLIDDAVEFLARKDMVVGLEEDRDAVLHHELMDRKIPIRPLLVEFPDAFIRVTAPLEGEVVAEHEVEVGLCARDQLHRPRVEIGMVHSGAAFGMGVALHAEAERRASRPLGPERVFLTVAAPVCIRIGHAIAVDAARVESVDCDNGCTVGRSRNRLRSLRKPTRRVAVFDGDLGTLLREDVYDDGIVCRPTEYDVLAVAGLRTRPIGRYDHNSQQNDCETERSGVDHMNPLDLRRSCVRLSSLNRSTGMKQLCSERNLL